MTKEKAMKSIGKKVLVRVYDSVPYPFVPYGPYIEGVLEDILVKSGRVYHKSEENEMDRYFMEVLKDGFVKYVVNIKKFLLKNGHCSESDFEKVVELGYEYVTYLKDLVSLDNDDMLTENQLKKLSLRRLYRLKIAVQYREETEQRNKYLSIINDSIEKAEIDESNRTTGNITL